MKKLLKLLNEYGKPSARNKKWEKLDLECIDRFYAISKYYGFIKRLVENDKIDVNKLAEKSECEVFLEFRRGEKDRRTDTVVMILAIQDEPIKFLISILK